MDSFVFAIQSVFYLCRVSSSTLQSLGMQERGAQFWVLFEQRTGCESSSHVWSADANPDTGSFET